MNNRQQRIKLIKEQLGDRKIIWMGNRSSETEGLEDFSDELACMVAVIAPSGRSDLRELVLEHSSMERVDLNNYSIDDDTGNEVSNLYNQLLRDTHRGTFVVVPYIPTMFLTSLLFSRSDTLIPWSVFYLKHKAYTYKPWVETELRKEGVKTIDWRYFSDGNINEFLDFAAGKPMILKISQGSGGAGIVLAKNPKDAERFCDYNRDRFFSASHYMEDAVPISINAVVYNDGQTRKFHPSVQLIGIPEATRRPFGFCGSDFVSVKQFDDTLWNKSDEMIDTIGSWLHKTGYRGVFGVDLLFDGEDVYFVEINPRFTASCTPSAIIARSLGITDPIIEHMAAMSGQDAPANIPLRELVTMQQKYPLSQVIAYNKATVPVSRVGDLESNGEYRVFELPDTDVDVAKDGELFKMEYRQEVSANGKRLYDEIAKTVSKNVKRWRTGQ